MPQCTKNKWLSYQLGSVWSQALTDMRTILTGLVLSWSLGRMSGCTHGNYLCWHNPWYNWNICDKDMTIVVCMTQTETLWVILTYYLCAWEANFYQVKWLFSSIDWLSRVPHSSPKSYQKMPGIQSRNFHMHYCSFKCTNALHQSRHFTPLEQPCGSAE